MECGRNGRDPPHTHCPSTTRVPAEFLAADAADRAITMGRVWQGLTLNCAQCHTQKYDPITHKELYQFTAFFNSVEEVGAGGVSGFHGIPVPPVMRVKTPQIIDEIADATAKLRTLDRPKTLIAAGRAPRPAVLDVAEHAAWTAAAKLILNLNETITRN